MQTQFVAQDLDEIFRTSAAEIRPINRQYTRSKLNLVLPFLKFGHKMADCLHFSVATSYFAHVHGEG